MKVITHLVPYKVRTILSPRAIRGSIPPLCSALQSGDNQWHFNDQDKANCLNDYFASISTVNDENTQLPPFTKLTDNSLSQIICTEQEIEKTIEVLNPNKASGDDGISHKMLRGVSKSVSKPLCILMNRSFEEGIFPDIWKIANVIPIFKKGDKSQPSNYRPVALLSCIGKLQERIVFKNMYNFLLDNNLLYKYQSGFLPHHSTVFQSKKAESWSKVLLFMFKVYLCGGAAGVCSWTSFIFGIHK